MVNEENEKREKEMEERVNSFFKWMLKGTIKAESLILNLFAGIQGVQNLISERNMNEEQALAAQNSAMIFMSQILWLTCEEEGMKVDEGFIRVLHNSIIRSGFAKVEELELEKAEENIKKGLVFSEEKEMEFDNCIMPIKHLMKK